MADLTHELNAKVAVLEECTKRIERKLDRQGVILHGNGTPTNGLVHKVSNLEVLALAIKSLLKWVIGIGGSILVGLFLKFVAELAGWIV